jgi:L-ascorbate metabolism protein UlaG (beta-lactamase superfamily)
MFEMKNYVIHVDPSRTTADYKLLPKANLILITHQHPDHCDPFAIEDVALGNVRIITTKSARNIINKGEILYNYQSITVNGIQIDAVPAYNMGNSVHHDMYHPKGEGNGYVLTIGSKRFYVAGDTDNIPEMKNLRNIDVAFMPMNLPNTMTPEMVADGISKFHPKILYPYHHRGTNVNKLFQILNTDLTTEVRIRKIY